MASPGLITRPTFSLADRLKIQQERSRNAEYIKIGKLTTVVLEAQRSTRGMSASKPIGPVGVSDRGFSEWQRVTWASMTLDWLSYKNGPTLAISKDRNDLLLPFGLTPLPDIPDPRWLSQKSTDVAPRIKQRLTGCPVLGDRACGTLKSKQGKRYLVFQPVTELMIFVGSGAGGFGRIRGCVDPADGTHLALLIDPDECKGYFVGGSFQSGF